MAFRRKGEAEDILRRKAHLPQQQGEGGGIVLAHPHAEAQGTQRPLLNKRNSIPTAVYPPQLRADRLPHGHMGDDIVEGSLGPLIFVHFRGNKLFGDRGGQLPQVGMGFGIRACFV